MPLSLDLVLDPTIEAPNQLASEFRSRPNTWKNGERCIWLRSTTFWTIWRGATSLLTVLRAPRHGYVTQCSIVLNRTPEWIGLDDQGRIARRAGAYAARGSRHKCGGCTELQPSACPGVGGRHDHFAGASRIAGSGADQRTGQPGRATRALFRNGCSNGAVAGGKRSPRGGAAGVLELHA